MRTFAIIAAAAAVAVTEVPASDETLVDMEADMNERDFLVELVQDSIADTPDLDQELAEVDPEDMSLAELQGWWNKFKKHITHAASFVMQHKEEIKKAAKLAWKHRKEIMAAAKEGHKMAKSAGLLAELDNEDDLYELVEQTMTEEPDLLEGLAEIPEDADLEELERRRHSWWHRFRHSISRAVHRGYRFAHKHRKEIKAGAKWVWKHRKQIAAGAKKGARFAKRVGKWGWKHRKQIAGAAKEGYKVYKSFSKKVQLDDEDADNLLEVFEPEYDEELQEIPEEDMELEESRHHHHHHKHHHHKHHHSKWRRFKRHMKHKFRKWKKDCKKGKCRKDKQK